MEKPLRPMSKDETQIAPRPGHGTEVKFYAKIIVFWLEVLRGQVRLPSSRWSVLYRSSVGIYAHMALTERVSRLASRWPWATAGMSLSIANRLGSWIWQRRVALAMSTIRNRKLMIDPTRNAASLSELMGKMSAELAQTHAQLTDMLGGAPSSQLLPALRRRVGALDDQIALERARITSSSDGLAERIAVYGRLILERDFGDRAMISAEADLARARSEAFWQQLCLERIVEPRVADYSTRPKRLANIATVYAANVIIFFVGWLIFAGVREHGAEQR